MNTTNTNRQTETTNRDTRYIFAKMMIINWHIELLGPSHRSAGEESAKTRAWGAEPTFGSQGVNIPCDTAERFLDIVSPTVIRKKLTI
jgi:hypothetical protein